MVQQKKDNKKQGKAEDFGVTELDADEFCEQEAEKFNIKYPELEIPGDIEDDIDNDYDIRDDEEEEDEEH